MKIKLLLSAVIVSCAMTLNAQEIEYEPVNQTVVLNYKDADMGNMYLTNKVDIQLAKSCNDANVNIASINTVVLKSIFGDYYSKFSSAQQIKSSMFKGAMSEDFEGYKWQPSRTKPAEDEMNKWEQTITAKPVSIYNGVLFYEMTNYSFMGGAHGMYAHTTTAINLATGQEVKASSFFNLAKQKSIVRMLTSSVNVKKYIVDAKNYDTSDCKEIAQSMKYQLQGDFTFPNFYIKDNALYILFGQEELGPAAMGAPEFKIPISVVNNAGTATPARRPAAKTATRRR